MRINKKTALILAFCMTLGTMAQQVNSLYFLKNVPYRSYLNPAFQTENKGYIGIPVIGYGNISIGNSQFSIKDFIYKGDNGQLVTFLHPTYGDKDKFYNDIAKNMRVNLNYQINLLSFGFSSKKNNFFSFDITQHIDGNLSVPKDIFKLVLYGTPERTNNKFNLKSLALNASVYTEFGLGYASKANDKLDIGFKLKFLLGTANASFYSKDLTLTTGTDQWTLNGTSQLQTSSPFIIKDDFSKIYSPEKFTNYLIPSGYGAAFDFGISYNILKNMQISASITDIGFIFWNKNVMNLSSKIDYSFTGVNVEGTSLLENSNPNGILDSLKTGLFNSYSNTNDEKRYFVTMPTAKLNIGLEYNFYKNKLGVGLLSRTMYANKHLYEEITFLFNIRPINWFNMNLSYSILNGKSSLGASIGLKAGPFLFFVASDYIPASYTSYNKIPVPYNTLELNISGGIVIVWNKRDKDKDGVPDKFDLCPQTPKGITVDSVGCPLDTDGDGVPDYLDLCPDTPQGIPTDSVGCPIDNKDDNTPTSDEYQEASNTAYGKVYNKIENNTIHFLSKTTSNLLHSSKKAISFTNKKQAETKNKNNVFAFNIIMHTANAKNKYGNLISQKTARTSA